MKEFKPCHRCKSRNGLPNGFYYKTTIQNNIEYKLVKECDCHKKWSKEKELYLKFIKSGFQENFYNYDIKSYLGTNSISNIKRFQKYIEGISNPDIRSSILYFYGINGTQKSTIANWIGKQIIQSNYDCKYILMNPLIKLLHSANMDEEKREELRKYEECDIIILDEAFTQKSQWGGYLDNFIKERIINRKGIIFISNYAPAMITEHGFDKSIRDLVEREILKRNSLFIFEDSYIANKDKIPDILF
jgi:DNA replication protein DnaC